MLTSYYAGLFFPRHIDWLSWGLTTRQPLWVILCHLPEKGRREIEQIAQEMKERDRGDKKMNESEGTEKIKTFPIYFHLLQGQQALPNCKPVSAGRPGDVRYKTPLPHQATPSFDTFLSYLWCIVCKTNDFGCDHFMVQIIAFTCSLTNASEHRVTTMSFGNIVDQFHNQYSLSYPCSSKQTCNGTS